MKLRFLSLASGSSGNCYYLGTTEYGILIDAGISARRIKKILKEKGIDFSTLMGVLVTHDHADHIRTIGYMGEKAFLPVYATEDVHSGIARSRYVEESLVASRRVITKEEPFTLRDFKITAFSVPHDSSDNVGYRIEFHGEVFAIATDIGHVTDTITKYASQVDHLIFEANYDKEMLLHGTYPAFLKERVAGPLGHLSNYESADFIAKIYTPRLKDIWLCHLSRDNNHPELAFKTVDFRLFEEGIRVGKDLHLVALKRMTPSDLYEFEVK